MYDLTNNDTCPSEGTVQGWIQKIAEHLKVRLRYTKRFATVLINRSYHMRKMMKKLKGGAPRQRFFSKSWTLQLEPFELEAVEHQEENAEAEEVVRSLLQELPARKGRHLSLQSWLWVEACPPTFCSPSSAVF